MFGRKKDKIGKENVVENKVITDNKEDIKKYLEAVKFVSDFVEEKKEKLLDEEVKSVCEIEKVKKSYKEVIDNNERVSDEIIGFVTRGRGVSIHRTDCINMMNLSNNIGCLE